MLVRIWRVGPMCAVITFWRDRAALDTLARSSAYLATVDALVATGILVGEASVEVMELQPGVSDIPGS